MEIGIIVGVVAFVAAVGAGISAKIVRQYQRLVLFRLGKAKAIRNPGLQFINPLTDRVVWVDMREQFLEIPRQTAITKDNASIAIDFIIFYKVVDPEASVLNVQNFAAAAQNVAATTLRSVVGDMPLDDVLSKRDEMNAALRTRLDDVTERWGVKVTTVEVREVNPPPGVLEAMTRQMSAERTRRAAVTEAQGQKQAAITLAEGKKQAAILGAEGDRQSAVLRAEGLSTSLAKMYSVGQHLDDNTMRLQYFETLKQVGSSPSTKLVLPMEIGGLLNGLRGMVGGGDGAPPAAPRRNSEMPGSLESLLPLTPELAEAAAEAAPGGAEEGVVGGAAGAEDAAENAAEEVEGAAAAAEAEAEAAAAIAAEASEDLTP